MKCKKNLVKNICQKKNTLKKLPKLRKVLWNIDDENKKTTGRSGWLDNFQQHLSTFFQS